MAAVDRPVGSSLFEGSRRCTSTAHQSHDEEYGFEHDDVDEI